MILRNPITKSIEKSIEETSNRLFIAVPFISNFVYKVLRDDNCCNIVDKKIITCFDEFNLNSFNVPALQKLMELGFEISYNNTIHLKVYIFDNSAILSSSNLTESGFENAIELSSVLSGNDISECCNVFMEIWKMDATQKLTSQILEENMDAYKLLKRKNKPITINSKNISKITEVIGGVDVTKIIKYVFDANEVNSKKNIHIYNSNEFREAFKSRLRNNFDKTDFYAPIGNPKRNSSFFYQVVYGDEAKLAGSGLREDHFKSVFEDDQLEELIGFIYPPAIGQPEWNLNDDLEMKIFCQGLFEFYIKSYIESMPLRLASFFYPDIFLPIFKLNHLEASCKILGAEIASQSNGEKYYLCTAFLNEKLKAIPQSNYIKSSMLYQIKYIKILAEMREEGLSESEINEKEWKKWEKHLLDKARIIIKAHSDI